MAQIIDDYSGHRLDVLAAIDYQIGGVLGQSAPLCKRGLGASPKALNRRQIPTALMLITVNPTVAPQRHIGCNKNQTIDQRPQVSPAGNQDALEQNRLSRRNTDSL